MLMVCGACLPDAKPDAGVRDGGAVRDAGTFDAGEAVDDAGVFCDAVPGPACISSGRYGVRLDGGVFDYRGPCAANQLAATLGGSCCDRMATSCVFTGGYSCTLPGSEAGSAPCCFDVCDGGEPCDCRRSGSCFCNAGSCGPRVPTSVCPIIGSGGP